MTHTYNRSLLGELDDESIATFIDITIHLLGTSNAMDPRIKEALLQRLKYRNAFLRTVSMAGDRSSMVSLQSAWSTTLQLLPGMKSERELATPVPDSFSVKLQRKLASTVPPRPVVAIEFDDAYQHLKKLCTDGLVVTEVLDFHDTNSLIVSPLSIHIKEDQLNGHNRTSSSSSRRASLNHQYISAPSFNIIYSVT